MTRRTTNGIRRTAGGVGRTTPLVASNIIDDFEDGDKTTLNSKWDGWKEDTGSLSVSGGVGDFTSSNDVVFIETSYEAQDTLTKSSIELDIDNQPGGGDAFVYNIVSTTRRDSGEGRILSVRFEYDGSIDILDPWGSYATGASWSTGTTYTIEISNIDYENYKFDVTISDSNGTVHSGTHDWQMASKVGDTVELFSDTDAAGATVTNTIDNVKGEIDSSLPVSTRVLDGLNFWYRMVNGRVSSQLGDWGGKRTPHDINGPSWTTTAKTNGQALSFDGTDDYTQNSGPVSEPAVQNDFSISVWIRPGASPAGRVIEGSVNTNDLETFNINAESTITADHVDGDSRTSLDSGVSVSSGTWYHVVLSHDASANDLELYVDGSLEASATSSTSGSRPTEKVVMGYRPYGNDQYYDGIIDDARIYLKPLSGTEASDIYNNTK